VLDILCSVSPNVFDSPYSTSFVFCHTKKQCWPNFSTLDPGSKGQKGTGSRIRIRNTETMLKTSCVSLFVHTKIFINHYLGDTVNTFCVGIKKFAVQLSSPLSTPRAKNAEPHRGGSGSQRKRPSAGVPTPSAPAAKVAKPIAIKKRPGNNPAASPKSVNNVPSPLKVLAAAGLTVTRQPRENNGMDVTDCITLD
jgi:hypothetical protein